MHRWEAEAEDVVTVASPGFPEKALHRQRGSPLELSHSHLHFGCNRLILLGAKLEYFTAKSLSSHREGKTLNQPVPGSSPGAPTK